MLNACSQQFHHPHSISGEIPLSSVSHGVSSSSLGWVRISTSIRVQEFQAAGPLLRSPDPTSSCITAWHFKPTLTGSPMSEQQQREIFLCASATEIKINGSLLLTVHTTLLQVPNPTQVVLRLPSHVELFGIAVLQPGS